MSVAPFSIMNCIISLSLACLIIKLSSESYFNTPAFYESTLVSGLSKRVFQLGFDLGLGVKIPLIPIALIVVFLLATFKHGGLGDKLYAYFFSACMIIVVGTHFHPQWALWALPFIFLFTLTVNDRKKKLWVALSVYILGWLGTFVLIDDNPLVFERYFCLYSPFLVEVR